MTGGSERGPGRPGVGRAGAVVAAVLVVVAGFGPSVGVALGTGGPSDGSLVPGELPPIADPTTGTDDGDRGREGTTAVPPVPTPNETSVGATLDPTTRETTPSTTEETTDSTPDGPPTTGESPATTGEPPDHTTAETTRSPTTGDGGDAEEPSDGPSGSPGVGSPGNGEGPPDDPRSGPGSGEGRTPDGEPPGVGNGGPPSVGNGEVPDRGNANRTGPPVNRTGPPVNRTGPPVNRSDRPGNANGHPSNATGHSGNSTKWPSNSTERPGNRTGWGNGTKPPGAADPEVNVTVENATANASVSVNVSSSAERDDDVSFSSVNVTPTRNGSFSLNVTASGDTIPGRTPAVELSNGTRPLGYLSVDHSIRDENISEVAFTFRVRTDRMNDAERDEIALYRFHGGTWNELPTTLVRTTDSHYVYRVRSPGLSEFAAGKKRPEFEIAEATATEETLSAGDALRVRVRVTNRGEADGTFTAKLVLDGEPVARRHVSIAAGGMRQTTFDRELAEPGTYEVYVNDYRVGEVTVDAATAAEGGSTTVASSDRGSSDAGSTDGASTPHPSTNEGSDHNGAGPDATGSAEHDGTGSNAADFTNERVDAGRMSAFGFGTVALLVGLVAGRRWRG